MTYVKEWEKRCEKSLERSQARRLEKAGRKYTVAGLGIAVMGSLIVALLALELLR